MSDPIKENPAMKLYDLINPSDPYTFYAPNIEVAGVAAVMLGTQYGATEAGSDEQTPVMFGWNEWLEARGIDSKWINDHAAEVAGSLRSILLSEPGNRVELDAKIEALPEPERAAWIAERHDRRRSSMNDIAARANKLAKVLEDYQ